MAQPIAAPFATRRIRHGCYGLGLCLLSLVGLLFTISVPGQVSAKNQQGQDLPKTKEEWDEAMKKHAEESRRIFDAVSCAQSNPAAVEAFSGCWKVGSVWKPPSEENLSLGMRASGDRFQLRIDSEGATQSADSTSPKYCTVQGARTAAPYPEYREGHYSYVYVAVEIPAKEAEKIARGLYDAFEKDAKGGISWKAYKKIFLDFQNGGGKYIRTLINQGPTHVWWDSDAEEDFWALPVACDGWDEIEQELKPQEPSPPKPEQ